MIFLELVPRDLNTLISDSKQYLAQYTAITGINIPDIKRLENRSFTAVEKMLENDITAMPHIRTQDFSLDEHLKIVSALYDKGLRHILLVSGDPSNDPLQKTYKVTPMELTKELKKVFRELKVYCGIDPYRQTMQREVAYALQKLEAGADGLFTQPFFDLNLAEGYLKQLSVTQLFMGVSPVITEKNKSYWVNVNHVVFPEVFEYTLHYNATFAKELIQLTQSYKQHNYLMPIKIDIQDYLDQVFR
ncbi:methylenetetrahydrofolate reductase [Candidatus Marinamargulisbacteria bacterium SCGC AG-343-D04]|nr:methylenetetrahydrofolate reductase [Candidatus Marinamargulisbacteria bacterium SCGC AG-343-D04]